MEIMADIKKTIADKERRFHRACSQIVLLNRHLDNLQLRYDHAHRDNMRTFRYSLRIKLSALEGVRNMYVEYASMKADEVTDLQCQLLEQRTLAAEDSDSLYDDDDDNDEFDDDEDQTEDEMMQ